MDATQILLDFIRVGIFNKRRVFSNKVFESSSVLQEEELPSSVVLLVVLSLPFSESSLVLGVVESPSLLVQKLIDFD